MKIDQLVPLILQVKSNEHINIQADIESDQHKTIATLIEEKQINDQKTISPSG